MSPGTVVVFVAVVMAVAFALSSIVRRRGGCGCGSCSGCEGYGTGCSSCSRDSRFSSNDLDGCLYLSETGEGEKTVETAIEEEVD